MKKIINFLFIGLIRLYQYLISPLFPPSCRFVPTCSQYAIEAIKKHGPIKGMALTAKRLSRCRPGKPAGHDPVP